MYTVYIIHYLWSDLMKMNGALLSYSLDSEYRLVDESFR